MFASFKRSPASIPENGNDTGTGTEKDYGADYADLEKRADGRWSVQNRPGALKIAIDTVHTDTDGKATERETRFGFLPAQVGVLLFTLFTLMLSGAFVGVTGMNIARNGERPPSCLLPSWCDRLTEIDPGRSMRHVDFLVTTISLSFWTSLFVICMLGLV